MALTVLPRRKSGIEEFNESLKPYLELAMKAAIQKKIQEKELESEKSLTKLRGEEERKTRLETTPQPLTLEDIQSLQAPGKLPQDTSGQMPYINQALSQQNLPEGIRQKIIAQRNMLTTPGPSQLDKYKSMGVVPTGTIGGRTTFSLPQPMTPYQQKSLELEESRMGQTRKSEKEKRIASIASALLSKEVMPTIMPFVKARPTVEQATNIARKILEASGEVGMGTMRVKNKKTGETGTIESNEFDSRLYEKL